MGQKEEAASIVEIDPNKLDQECINLPKHYVRYAFLSSEAKRDVDEAKAELDVVKADLANKIRRTPSKYHLEKVTESSVAATIETLPECRAAAKALRKAKHRQEMCQAVVWALEHKKRSLTLLVELHGMGWFGNVKMTEKGRDAVKSMRRKRVASRMNELKE